MKYSDFFRSSFFLEKKSQKINRKKILQIDKKLPDAILKNYGQPDVHLSNLKGKIKIISVVPQLNTPVCDEQTHRFSEKNGGLDRNVNIITISTNSAEGQYQFAKKANIKNLLFLSAYKVWNLHQKFLFDLLGKYLLIFLSYFA